MNNDLLFERSLTQDLTHWKNNPRLPLIVKGARQVGKSFLIKHWGQSHFKKIHEFNFQKNKNLHDIFKTTQDPNKIISQLEILINGKINLKNELIFFDEIQDCPEALNSLKFFAEDMPDIYLISAGSLLGIYLSEHSFPVGKIQFLNLYPLSFVEFLSAIGLSQLANTLKNNTTLPLAEHIQKINGFHSLFIENLKKYYSLGGMPKVISEYLKEQNYNSALEVQKNLLLGYQADFAKYSGSIDALKILSVFQNIPQQLAKDNSKFLFNLLKKGARYNQFSSAIDWLINAGLCYKVPIINNIEIPLKVYSQENNFKLYFFDVGLLAAHSDIPKQVFLSDENIFKTFKGSFAENFVLTEFKSHHQQALFCWQGRDSEVDFVFQDKADIIPIEVKSGTNSKLKSLNVYSEKYKPKYKIRCSLNKLLIREDLDLKSYPLYCASLI